MCGSSIAWFAVRSFDKFGEPRLVRQPAGHVDADVDALPREAGRARRTRSRRRIQLQQFADGAVPRMTQQAALAVIHTPDKSALPFASRGVAADRSTSPFAVRGARGLGCLNH